MARPEPATVDTERGLGPGTAGVPSGLEAGPLRAPPPPRAPDSRITVTSSDSFCLRRHLKEQEEWRPALSPSYGTPPTFLHPSLRFQTAWVASKPFREVRRKLPPSLPQLSTLTNVSAADDDLNYTLVLCTRTVVSTTASSISAPSTASCPRRSSAKSPGPPSSTCATVIPPNSEEPSSLPSSST